MKRDVMVLLVVIFIIAGIFISYLLFPSVIYDRWIWKYYWGPVVADAKGGVAEYHGIVAHEGYTLVSEITYGIIAMVAIYYIYRLFRRLKIDVDWKLCVSLLPFFIYGSVSRVLEDAGFFRIPLSFFFISPLIYVQIAAIAIISVVVGWLLERKRRYMIVIYGGAIIAFYGTFWFVCRDMMFHPLNPLIFALIVVVVFSVFMVKGDINRLSLPFITGLVAVVSGFIAIYLVARENIVRMDVFAVCLIFPVAITLFAYLLGRYVEKLGIFSQPLNLSMLFGHALDGFTSYISIYDPFGMGIPPYGEKHPVSFLFMDISGGILYPIIKIVLIILIILIFDEMYREEEKYRDVLNLLKIAIFILGFSPGLRDLLRVTLSV